MKRAISAILAAVFVLSFFAFASATVETKFYGYEWLRYDYQVVGGSYGTVAPSSNNMFSIPRTYLRWKITDADAGYEGNLTLDINNTNSGEAGTGKIDWASWLKKASVDFTKIPFLSDIDVVFRAGQQDVYFGAIDTWAYPVIEKVIEDKQGIISSADQGIALVGKIPAGFGGYELALYNGSGYKTTPYDDAQDITDKAYDASLLITPIAGLYARASYLHKLTNSFGVPAKPYSATAIVVGGSTGPIEGFCEYLVSSIAKNADATHSGVSVGVSGYLGVKIIDQLSLQLRIDTWNPDTRVARDEKNTYIAGLNYKLNDKITLQLNYQLDAYRYPFSGGSKDNNLTNNNQWLSQLVWNW